MKNATVKRFDYVTTKAYFHEFFVKSIPWSIHVLISRNILHLQMKNILWNWFKMSFSFTLFWQKFRRSNVVTKEVTKQLISRKKKKMVRSFLQNLRDGSKILWKLFCNNCLKNVVKITFLLLRNLHISFHEKNPKCTVNYF